MRGSSRVTAAPTLGSVLIAQRLAGLIDGLVTDRVLVAFDGPDAAGKTSLALAVAEHMTRPAVCATVDAWHNPRDVRMRRGGASAEGYYRDSFNLDALTRDLLTPFRRGAPRVQVAGFDYLADAPIQAEEQVASRAALLFDGVFLLRPELVASWDLRVYLHVPEQVTLSRAAVRDGHLFGEAEAVRARYQARYLPGQALYRNDASPLEVADIVLDNSDWQRPVVLRWPKDG